jgi:general secretion pathway protein H
MSQIDRRAEGGFTLLEVLVALTILSLVTFSLGGATLGGRSRAVLSGARSSLDEALVSARAVAQARGVTTFVSFDLPGRRLRTSTSPGHWRLLPKEIDLSLVTAGELTLAGMPAIAFLPDGTSSGGEIIISIGPQKAIRRIDWLTGALLDAEG